MTSNITKVGDIVEYKGNKFVVIPSNITQLDGMRCVPKTGLPMIELEDAIYFNLHPIGN